MVARVGIGAVHVLRRPDVCTLRHAETPMYVRRSIVFLCVPATRGGARDMLGFANLIPPVGGIYTIIFVFDCT